MTQKRLFSLSKYAFFSTKRAWNLLIEVKNWFRCALFGMIIFFNKFILLWKYVALNLTINDKSAQEAREKHLHPSFIDEIVLLQKWREIA